MHARTILTTATIALLCSPPAWAMDASRPRVEDAIAYLLDDIEAQEELAPELSLERAFQAGGFAEAEVTLGEDDGADGPFSDAEEIALEGVVSPSRLTRAGLRLWGRLSAPSELEGAPAPLAYGALARIHDTLQGAWSRWFDEPFYEVRLSSRYGKRFHPVLKRWRLHNGIDLAARRGTPVRSAADGEVEFAGWRGAAGKYVFIRHADGWGTGYMHLHTIDDALEEGAKVTRGQLIGAVGTTGRSTGPHLHFSVKRDGEYVDPLEARDFAYSAPIRGSGRKLYYELHVKPFLAARAGAAEAGEELALAVAARAAR